MYCGVSFSGNFRKTNILCGFTINFTRCKMLIFTRSRSALRSQYFLNGNAASHTVDRVMDLGFKLISNLDPSNYIGHIEHVCFKH